jgi:hypothetical protein
MYIVYILFSVLFVLVLGCWLGWWEPKNKHFEIDEVELTRRLAKNKGYVLHPDAYNNGVELYVQPQDVGLSYEFLKSIGLKRKIYNL